MQVKGDVQFKKKNITLENIPYIERKKYRQLGKIDPAANRVKSIFQHSGESALIIGVFCGSVSPDKCITPGDMRTRSSDPGHNVTMYFSGLTDDQCP